MKKINIFKVAIFFLNIVDRDLGGTLTPLKLQKILYYAQGYYLAIKDKELFSEEFEAWTNGPANPEIYEKYKAYNCKTIDAPIKEEVPDFDAELIDFLYDIWNTFGIYDGKYLIDLTHSEEPWINARKGYQLGEICNEVIPKETMKIFFKNKLNEQGI